MNTRELSKKAHELWMSGDRANAGIMFARAIDGASDDPTPLIALAHAATATMDLDIAKEAYAGAIKLTPNDARLRVRRANILISLGDFDDALSELNHSLETEPGSGLALFTLARISEKKDAEELIARVKGVLDNPVSSLEDQGYADFALAKLYDDVGEWDDAFRHAQAANARVAPAFDRAAYKDAFDRIEAAFTVQNIERAAGVGHMSSEPIFIAGAPRSGSSLIEKRLAAHADVCALGEIGSLPSAIGQVPRTEAGRGFPEALVSADPYRLKEIGQWYCENAKERLPKEAPAPLHFTDKNPMNLTRVGAIKLLLPNASVIHADRDFRDGGLSIFFQSFDPAVHPYSYSLADTGYFLGLMSKIARHWDEVLPGFVHRTEYKSLIDDPTAATAAMFDKIGLDGATDGASEDAVETAIHTSSAWQARQPIHETSVDRWRHYEPHLAPLIDAFNEADPDAGIV